jgi:hypothetical protein
MLEVRISAAVIFCGIGFPFSSYFFLLATGAAPFFGATAPAFFFVAFFLSSLSLSLSLSLLLIFCTVQTCKKL